MKEITAIGNVPFPTEDGHPLRGTKRTRDGDDVYPIADPTCVAESNVNIAGFEPRAMAGSHRVQQQQQLLQQRQQQQQQQQQRAVNGSPSSLSSGSVPSPPSYMHPAPQPPPPQNGLDPLAAYAGQWMSSEEAFRITLGMTNAPNGAFGGSAGPSSFGLPTQQQQQQQQQQSFQASMFAPASEFPVDFSGTQHPYSLQPLVTPDVWQAAGTTPVSPPQPQPQPQAQAQPLPQQQQQQQPQQDDAMAASQFFDSDILAMLSSAPTSLEYVIFLGPLLSLVS